MWPTSRANASLTLNNNNLMFQVPGYVKFTRSMWLYSPKTLDVVEQYQAKFPEVFDYLKKRANSNYECSANDVFGLENGKLP